MSTTSNTGTAILGAGIFAKEAHLPALQALGPLAPKLKAIYSRSEKSAREFAAEATTLLNTTPDVYFDGNPSSNLDALLARSDISSVIIILPITQQPSIILKALAAGKHVLSEKPVSADVASGAALIAQYEAQFKPKGLVWRVAENHEAEPGHIAAGRAIAAGKIGKVIFFSSRAVNFMDQDSKWYKTPWRTVPDYQGGFLLDGGVHFVAALRVILPSSMTHLSGFASLNKNWLAPHDTINATIKAADGSHGTFELSFAAPSPSRSGAGGGGGIIITGTDGWLQVQQMQARDFVHNTEKRIFRITVKSATRDANGVLGPEKEEVIDEPIRGVEMEQASFFAALEGKDDGLGSPFGALKDVAVIEAALTSDGKLMDLEKLIGYF
ncbi:NAD(P)-binding protein [Rhizopogon vinicolor AM-OR11-026]|uniref:NAD(P)-binding protein n=1 Tax=Rhizopogon vinicolor AM-OR11-026 TaxID=1314800 RepID=A0A1B7MHU1_9AGAM|nr:NAD(P)-binding protein [Rhizopogon vinicolor AM-OR11-026]